jgi:hypothetical protein
VSLVIEIVSPGSVRTDRLTKCGEYADARIPHYWIVDITRPVSILVCHLAGEFGYVDSGEITGAFTAREPFPSSWISTASREPWDGGATALTGTAGQMANWRGNGVLRSPLTAAVATDQLAGGHHSRTPCSADSATELW